jgi:hypothetical protein
MSRRPTAPMLPGWGPIVPPAYPRRRRGGAVARWWWPALVTVGFLALVGYILDRDQAPDRAGPSVRGLLVLGLALVAIVVLTVRRDRGPRALLATVAEYAIVGVLVASLVALSAPDAPAPAREPARRRLQPVRVEAADRPSNPLEWLTDLWHRAGQLANHDHHSPTAKE